MAPEKVSVACSPASLSVSVLPPSVTVPAPDRPMIEVPPLVSPEIVKVPSSATSALALIEPVPESASVPP